jgi:hypothetical protein
MLPAQEKKTLSFPLLPTICACRSELVPALRMKLLLEPVLPALRGCELQFSPSGWLMGIGVREKSSVSRHCQELMPREVIFLAAKNVLGISGWMRCHS